MAIRKRIPAGMPGWPGDQECGQNGRAPGLDGQDTYGLEPVLTVDEAARFLRVNRKTLYEAVKAGDVPARRVGRRVVILRDALVQWLQSD